MKKILAVLLAAVMLMSLSSALAEEKPDTWIADRIVRVQAYVDDIGYSLPDDQLNTPVMQELQRLTGMKVEFLYTPGEKDRYVLAAQLATGDLPDMIVFYLNNSARPEFPILLKGVNDGLFTDVAPYMKDCTYLSKYFDETWTPADTYSNIMFRDEFNGACYIVHRGINRLGRQEPVIWKETSAPGGLYIQASIAEDLGIDTRTINSSEALYDLLLKIKEKDYKDLNGNTVVPMGPKYWGGSPDAVDYIVYDLCWGLSGDFNMNEEGKILHEAETDYVYKKIDFFRRMLADGLVHKEYFTMDATRAAELYANLGAAVVSDIHAGVEIIYNTDKWVPLGPIANYKGSTKQLTSGAGGYGGWAIPATTANPEELVKLMDFLCSREGLMLAIYGVEGLTYTLDDAGNPVPTAQVMECLANNDTTTLRNFGASFDGSGVYGIEYLTDMHDDEYYFGVSAFGENVEGGKSAVNDRVRWLSKNFPMEYEIYSGLYINSFMTEMEDFNTAFNLLSYDDMFIQACFAKDQAAVEGIVESFRAQLKAAGVEAYEDFVEAKYAENNDAVFVY